MELMLFFIFLMGFLFVLCALIFKVAMMYQKMSELNALISNMINAGVSLEALQLAENYYDKEGIK